MAICVRVMMSCLVLLKSVSKEGGDYGNSNGADVQTA